MFGINWYCELLLCLQLYFASSATKQYPDESRTHFGKELSPGDVPYIVGIIVEDLLCTGAIVTSDMVISSAQCFKTSDPKLVKLYIGIGRIQDKSIYFEVKSIHTHPNYKPAPKMKIGAYDVAILKLTRKIPPEQGIPVIVSMDKWEENEEPKKCRIAGYGMHKSIQFGDGSGIAVLHGSIIDVSRNSQSCSCGVLTSEEKKTVICLGPGTKDRICYGDYGGAPMVCDKKLVGLAHGQVGCPNFTVPIDDIMMCGGDNLVDIYLWIRPMLGFLASYIPGIEDPNIEISKGDKNFPASLVLYTTILFPILLSFSPFSK